jgi:imidazolonepropionase-like amidohydrolase
MPTFKTNEMKRFLLSIAMAASVLWATAQETILPAPKQTEPFVLTHATVHVGNGKVIENANVQIANGKIVEITTGDVAYNDIKVINCKGKHIYPGLILSISNLGLLEVPSVRATRDETEIGDLNPNVRSIVAYNTDSKVQRTLLANGILFANIVPAGSLMMGSSSVVQLDAWNWEDAAYKVDGGIHLNMPSLVNRPVTGFFGREGSALENDALKRNLAQIEACKDFLRQAKAYHAEAKHESINLKFEAVKGLLEGKQTLFVHCDIVKEMLLAIDFAKEFGCKVVIVGGIESYRIAPLLKEHNIAVILGQSHSLPTTPDDDVDLPYKTAALLQKAGVLVAINDDDGNSRFRNLPFNAGTAAAYGLTKEEALATVTLNAAKILGIDATTGSVEVGKDANILVSEGDILDMRTNKINQAFIQGRNISLDNKQKQLYQRYNQKYGLPNVGM